MRLIVGLGNPGDRYRYTRHNVGFWVVDELAKRSAATWKGGRFKSELAEARFNGESVLLVKPQTFMNASGEAVRPLADYYKVPPSCILAVYDDMNLGAGVIRLRARGSAGGHNGMKSLIQHLGTEDFPRLRVGIGAPGPGVTGVDYVLTALPKESLLQLSQAADIAAEAASCWVLEGIDKAMSRYNGVIDSRIKPCL